MSRLTDIRRALQSGPELHLPRRRPKFAEAPRRRPERGSSLSAARARLGGISLPGVPGRTSADGLVGVEFEADSVAVVELGEGSTVARSAIAPLPPGAFVDGEVVDAAAITAALRKVWSNGGFSKRVRLGVANQRVVTRAMQLPNIQDSAQLAKAIRFQAEEQLPMPLEQAVLDHRVVGLTPGEDGAPDTIEVVVSAARREMVGAALKPLRDAGLDPVGIDLSAFALIRAMGDPVGGAEPKAGSATVLFCNVGDTSNLAIAKGRICRFTRVSPAGIENTVVGLCERTGMSAEHARMWLVHVGLGRPTATIEGEPAVVEATRAALEGGAADLLDELRLTIDFYGAQEAADPVDRVVLGGVGGVIPGLVDHLAAGLGLPVVAGPPPALATMDPSVAARLTLPYGLALEE